MNKLESYIKSNSYKGYDPYDSLNSPILRLFGKSKFLGIAFTQFFKRSPLNFRKLFFVKKEYNPKALALFIKGLVLKNELDEAKKLADILINLKSDRSYPCWGYNFPWYAKAFMVKKFEPNMVTTVFAADALLDLYDKTKEDKYKDLALKSKNFLLKELILYEDKETLCFRYIPREDARVHNANLFGALLLARIYSYTKETKLKTLAKKSVEYSIRAQKEDGSWFYGEMLHHKWIDNFHTGYNLCAINRYMKYTGDKSYVKNMTLGLKYHLNNHFLKDMTPKYYNDELYPIDIHNYAQGIITFLEFNLKDKAKSLAKKAELMQSKKGYFYYQKTKFGTNKISYMRWSQAWMFYALSKLEAEL